MGSNDGTGLRVDHLVESLQDKVPHRQILLMDLDKIWTLSDFDKLCGRPPQYAPPPDFDLCPFDLENGVLVTCDVRYLCANFGLPRPLCSRLKPDVRDRQTDRQTDVR